MTRKLLLLNGLAAIMVVLNHSASYGLNALFFWTDRYLPVSVPNFDQYGSLAYYILFFIHELAEFAIPAFLFGWKGLGTKFWLVFPSSPQYP